MAFIPNHPTMQTGSLKANWRIFRHFTLWFIIPTVLHYLLSIYCLFRFREEIAYARYPDGNGFDSFLYSFTVHNPEWRISSWPVTPSDLATMMIPQSILLGVLVAIFFGSLFVAWLMLANYLRPVLCIFCIPVILGLFFIISFMLSGLSYSLHVSSAHLPPQTEKMRWLTRFFDLQGEMLATEYEFEISGGLGPSTCDASIAVKVPPQDVTKWVEKQQRYQFKPCIKDDLLPQVYTLRLHDAIWEHSSPPKYFDGSGASATVYRREGIIFFTIDY